MDNIPNDMMKSQICGISTILFENVPYVNDLREVQYMGEKDHKHVGLTLNVLIETHSSYNKNNNNKTRLQR